MRSRLGLGLALLLLATGACYGRRAYRDALWHVVSACELSARMVGVAFPCLSVESGTPGRPGFVVLRSPNLKTEVLVVPTDPVADIESPALLKDDAIAYWQAAWEARKLVPAWTRGRDGVALAVNARGNRTQDQLHIHVDCMDRNHAALIAAHIAELGPRWVPFPEPMENMRFQAIVLPGDDLSAINPVALAQKGLPAPLRASARLTVAVMGTVLPDGRNGFVILANRVNGSAEMLLNHSCE